MSVKRYSHYGFGSNSKFDPEGHWVRYSDYAELKTQLDMVRPYVQHKRDCDAEVVHYAYEPECTCGLATIKGESDE